MKRFTKAAVTLTLFLLAACSVTREVSLQQVGPERQKYAYREGMLSQRPATFGEGLLDAAGAVFTSGTPVRSSSPQAGFFECECRIREFERETPCVSLNLLVSPRNGAPFLVKTDPSGRFSFPLPKEGVFAINGRGGGYLASFEGRPKDGSCILHLRHK